MLSDILNDSMSSEPSALSMRLCISACDQIIVPLRMGLSFIDISLAVNSGSIGSLSVLGVYWDLIKG